MSGSDKETVMGEAFRIGGWGMYPTTIIGFILLGAALLYARQPTARRLRVIANLRLLTFLSGALGCVVGVIKSFTTLPEGKLDEVGKLAVIGVGESLSNIALALVILVVATILTTIGASRGPADDAELVDPRAG